MKRHKIYIWRYRASNLILLLQNLHTTKQTKRDYTKLSPQSRELISVYLQEYKYYKNAYINVRINLCYKIY